MDAVEKFMHVVEAEAFEEGHEVLETLWRTWKNEPLLREESYILKALINGATALALIRLGRKEGAMRVWETFLKYRPLITTTPSAHTALYQQAQMLLERKYQALVC